MKATLEVMEAGFGEGHAGDVSGAGTGSCPGGVVKITVNDNYGSGAESDSKAGLPVLRELLLLSQNIEVAATAATLNGTGGHNEFLDDHYDDHDGNDGTNQNVVPAAHSQDYSSRLQYIMENISILAHLVLFSIIGVLIRYGLQVLFGPKVARITSDSSALHQALAPNMVGSYFMGWVGIVFKDSLPKNLAIGLSTGLMGSTTTFSLWIHEMVQLTTQGHLAATSVGLLIGMELSYMSLLLGIESACFCRSIISSYNSSKTNKEPHESFKGLPISTREETKKERDVAAIITAVILWVSFLALLMFEVGSSDRIVLWRACVIGPFGTWLRWVLAKLNDEGHHNIKCLKWLRVGTLLANIIATNMLALANVAKNSVTNDNIKWWIRAFDLGFVGCLSTVSTFVAEIYNMRKTQHLGRAYGYIVASVLPSFFMSACIYFIAIGVQE